MMILHDYAELSACEASTTSGTSRKIYHQILGLMRPRFSLICSYISFVQLGIRVYEPANQTASISCQMWQDRP